MPPLKPDHISPTDEEDAAITAAAMADPDTFHPTEENLAYLSQVKPYRIKVRGRPVGTGQKQQLTVRFDRDVIAAFRALGDGWQTKMNKALKDWLLHNDPTTL
ncbi:MAG: BrnA antitoxin family protein [Pelistega sp.]|nr:BrnA antitoxin family protein [Pelistega sp.]